MLATSRTPCRISSPPVQRAQPATAAVPFALRRVEGTGSQVIAVLALVTGMNRQPTPPDCQHRRSDQNRLRVTPTPGSLSFRERIELWGAAGSVEQRLRSMVLAVAAVALLQH